MTTKIISRNPATGEIIRELDSTPPEQLPEIFARARSAQAQWALLSARRRAFHLLQLRETIINRADEIIDLLSKENGKPRFEALANEVLAVIDNITYFAKAGPKLLKNRRIPLMIARHRRSYYNYWPVGVVVIISPWNYPFMLSGSSIVQALMAGNAVVFKPSEVTPLIGLKIQELCEEAGLPAGIIQTVIGDGSLGAAVIEQKPNKIFFTGSTATGRKVMKAAAEHLIPVNLELGGKDPMIVLPDADLDFATSAALWGGFSNSGQICASTERVLVHESIAQPFLNLLREKTGRLRVGQPIGACDIGAITLDKQKLVYESQLQDARDKGVEFITGGNYSRDQAFMSPTIASGPAIESTALYNEETFGPTLAVTTFRSLQEAIDKANRSKYGLLASVITRNLSLGEQVARQLEVGTVIINEVAFTGGLAETPWGGVKESGFGRTRSELGLYEFVNVRHINRPRSRLFCLKSLWWFPYSPYQYETFRYFIELYRRHWTDKIRAFPHFLWNLVKFLKEEPRL